MPLRPDMVKSNEGMSELSTEMIELRQALLRGKFLSPLERENNWPMQFLKLVHPQEEKQNPGARKRQAVEHNNRFEHAYGSYFPKAPNGMYRDVSFINPFLKTEALDFYGGRVALSLTDKGRVLENELIRDYQMRLQQAEQEKEAVLNEHVQIRKFFNQVRELSDSRQLEIVDLRQQLQAKE